MKRVAYIGETTGDNLQVAPNQLLDMIGDSIANDPGPPVLGILTIVVREKPDGTLDLTTFRCGLPKFVEVAVVTRNYLRTLGVAISADA